MWLGCAVCSLLCTFIIIVVLVSLAFFCCSVKLVLISTHEFCLLFPDSHPHPTVLGRAEQVARGFSCWMVGTEAELPQQCGWK